MIHVVGFVVICLVLYILQVFGLLQLANQPVPRIKN